MEGSAPPKKILVAKPDGKKARSTKAPEEILTSKGNIKWRSLAGDCELGMYQSTSFLMTRVHWRKPKLQN